MTDPLFNNSPASNLLAELGLDARHGAVAMVERYGREVAEEMRERCARECEARATSEQITADRLRERWLNHEHVGVDEMEAAERRVLLLREEAASLRALPTTGAQR